MIEVSDDYIHATIFEKQIHLLYYILLIALFTPVITDIFGHLLAKKKGN